MRFNVDDLVAKKLVTKKTYTDGPFAGLSVLKYKNNVFWDNLWSTDPRLLECRGMVVDADDNVVIWPFTKIFNRFENGTDLPSDKVVDAVRKVNGFMASAGVYKGQLVVSTTGTLESEFTVMAKNHIIAECNDIEHFIKWTESAKATFLFEICDPSDPHIVAEDAGAYLIGVRIQNPDGTSFMLPEGALDGIANVTKFKRPIVHQMIKFSDVVEMSQKCQHEGYVVREPNYPFSLLLKIKSPHYLAKKFLMRGGDNKWDMIWDNPNEAKKRIDEEYYDLLYHIREYYSKDTWAEMDSQKRRQVVEDYFAIEDLFDRGSRFYVGVQK